MIKVFCDKCGKEIDYESNGLNLNFNSYGIIKFKKYEDTEFQLCKDCANEIYDFIKDKGVMKNEI